MASGVLFVALVLSGNEVAATFRAEDLDPQIARYAFDEGQAAFANTRMALGSFAVSCGWVIASTQFLPRWVGWLAIASGVGLALSRISWTSYIWLAPYLIFWLWMITVSILLLRRNLPRRQPGRLSPVHIWRCLCGCRRGRMIVVKARPPEQRSA